MAFGSGALTANEIADFAADKPLAAVQTVPMGSDVRWTEVGTFVATDRTDADYPTSWAYDGYPDYKTQPDSTAASTWYLIYDFGAGNEIDLDCAFIIGHNFGTLSLTTVQVEIADDSLFTVNLTTIADFGSPADDTRLVDYSLNALRYTNIRYLRLKLSRGSNFTPEIGELFLGRRRQLGRKPDRPFDDYARARRASVAETLGGKTHSVLHYDGKFMLEASWILDDATYVSDWKAFGQACTGPFVWSYDPTTYPDSWYLMTLGDLDMWALPMVEPSAYEAFLSGAEQGPEDYFLAKE